jgi:uncharacterized protein (DUF488 family)
VGVGRDFQAFTVGHSNRTLAGFIALIQGWGVTDILDVRAFPHSRANPHFNIETLPAALAEHDLGYRHLPELGGRRRTSSTSINTAWRSASFRGYADYMQTDAFELALQPILVLLSDRHPALMCAEAVPWRCHRSLIADALVARVIRVGDILSETRCEPHNLPGWAVVQSRRVSYP